ncbi:hypothetical protein D3C87_366950 [compost metagenome]
MMTETINRQILTIANTKKAYFDMAINLARSFIWWHPDSSIQFKIVTDLSENLPTDLANIIQLQRVLPGELGTSFSAKLHLDKLADNGQTLFIDSDCLIFGNLDFLFERFKNHKVSVIGSYIREGEWFGSIKEVCDLFKIPHLPKFNGGIYYLEKGKAAADVFSTARTLEKRYDEIGFVRLRNNPNDEVLMALAMQLHGHTPIPDDGMAMSDPQACPGGYAIDVIRGNRWLLNPAPPSPKHQDWYPFLKVSPVIFHFLGYYTQHQPYKREAYRLEMMAKNRLNHFTEAYAVLKFTLPDFFKNKLKDNLRPLYRFLFGVRKIKPSNRI